MVNVDFKFDFKKHITDAYSTTDVSEKIKRIASSIDSGTVSTEVAISQLITLNSSVLSDVLCAYNQELLNEIEIEN